MLGGKQLYRGLTKFRVKTMMNVKSKIGELCSDMMCVCVEGGDKKESYIWGLQQCAGGNTLPVTSSGLFCDKYFLLKCHRRIIWVASCLFHSCLTQGCATCFCVQACFCFWQEGVYYDI